MNEDTWNRVKRIFHEAVSLAGEERAGFLAEACADDAAVRSEVEELLEAHDVVDEPLTASVVGASERAREIEGVGATIGRYKLLQRIGEGGFGVVYMAEQEEPIRRRVALKIIKLGMDTRQVVARFEAERQALALMDHPNIAKVLDAGATDTGRPYFVMELVKGVSITGYCDANNLSTSERLRLFVEVCHAVQHAHQKGVIHRDIKPTNVMVTLHDGTPVPKVIDFGVAKAMHQRLTEKTLFTAYGQFIGTPAYMSPEQAEMSGLDIDTRSDVYSLGALLYELLTGTTPFDSQSLRRAAYVEIQRMLKEVEPPRPSTRLTTLGEPLEAIARHRKTDPGSLARLIRGDLDWIVMKALEKDRTRRYGSASDLSADIARHFGHEPVMARPPSRSYRLRKFVTKHRGPVAAAAVVGTTIVVLGSLSMWLGWSAQRAAERMQATAVVASAAAAADPLVKALLVLEVADRPDTPGLLSVAREAANFALPMAVLRGHERTLTGAAFSPDGSRVVTTGRDGTAHVYGLDEDRGEPVVLMGYPYGIGDVAFSPHGRLVGATSNGGVWIWRSDGTGEAVVLGTHQPQNEVFAFSPDETRVATGGANGMIRIWQADGTVDPIVLRGYDDAVLAVAFSPDGVYLATVSEDAMARIQRADGTGTPITLEGHAGGITGIAFTADGGRVVTASADGTARVWRSDGTGTPVVLRGPDARPLSRAAFTPDGSRVITWLDNGTAMVWSADGIRGPITLEEPGGRVIDVADTPGGVRVVAAVSNTVKVWRVDLVRNRVELRGHEFRVNVAAFSPDGTLLVTVGEITARVWRIGETGESIDLEGDDGRVVAATFSPDGTHVVTTLVDGTARVRRVDGTGEPVSLRGHEGAVLSAAFSPDGTRVATGSTDGTARVWLANGAGESIVLQGHTGTVQSVGFSPDGTRVATASDDTTARVWRADGMGPPIILRGHEGAVGSAAFSPDGVHVLTLSEDRTARVWQADGAGEPIVLRGREDGLWAAKFSPDGSRVVTASSHGTAVVWRTDGTGDPVVFEGHLDEVFSAEFSPDGTHVVSASTDSTARMWSADDAREIAVFRGHTGFVTHAAFNPDGSQVVTATPRGVRPVTGRTDISTSCCSPGRSYGRPRCRDSSDATGAGFTSHNGPDSSLG